MNEIVTIQHRKAVTTSLVVAEVFGKRHDTVLRSIKNLECSGAFRLRNFVESSYQNEQSKMQPMYTITRDGFSFLAMGFTGKKAARFKERYIDAFNSMEQALLNQQNLSWQQQRLDGKAARRLETDTISRFVAYATAQGSKSAKMYFVQITKMTHQALFMVKQSSPKAFREMLDSMQLSFLTTAEYLVHQALEDGMAAALHYKDIYAMARERVTYYADRLPQQRLLHVA